MCFADPDDAEQLGFETDLFLCETPSVALYINIVTKDLKSTSSWKLAMICLCFVSKPFPALLAGNSMLLLLARCLWSTAFYQCGWGTIWAKCGNMTLQEITAGEKWYLNIPKTCSFFLGIVSHQIRSKISKIPQIQLYCALPFLVLEGKILPVFIFLIGKKFIIKI